MSKGVVEEVWKTRDRLTWHKCDMPMELNLCKPFSWASSCFLPSFLCHLRCLPIIPAAAILLSLVLSFSHPSDELCFIFQLLSWSLKHVLLYHKGKVPNPDELGGNMARKWNSQKTNSLIKEVTFERLCRKSYALCTSQSSPELPD